MTPFSTPQEFYQERDFGQKISATFDFIRAHFTPLGRCLLYYVLPVPLVGSLVAMLVARLFFSSGSVVLGSLMPAMLMSWPPLMLGHLLLILTVYGYVILRMDTPAHLPVTPAMVGAWIKPRFLPNLGALVVLGVLLVLAFLFLIIPGIWLSIPASLFFIVRLREERTIGSSLDRSIYLTKNKWWSTFGLILVMSMIVSILPFMLQMVMTVSMSLIVGVLGVGGISTALFFVTTISNLLSLLLYPLVLLALAFQYFNLRERKEGTGVYALLDQLGQPASTSAATHEYRPSVADEEGEY